jgi:putative ABC transport system permease protein
MFERLTSWLRAVVHRDAFEDEMAEEMRQHLEARAADLVRRGVAPAEAARRSRLAFGSIEKHRDLARASFGLRLIDDLKADARLALRRLAAAPSRSLLIIFTIALGIGAATSVFSVVDQTVLRPAPFLYADRLVDVMDYSRKANGGGSSLSPAKILGWQSQPALFERFEGLEAQEFDIGGDGTPERVSAQRVSLGLFPMLGVAPAIGRGFVDGDGQPGSPRVVIISDGLWRRRFAGRPDALGRLITLNDQDYTVVGVMPRRFSLGVQQLWVPLDLRAYADQTRGFGFMGVGRLARGVAMKNAQDVADRLSDRLQQQLPLPRSWDLRLMPKQIVSIDPTTRTAMLVLLGAVGFVLLITCANVTSILLTTVPARMREMAVRSALGGSRLRLMRSMLAETTILAGVGGVVGVLLAQWVVRTIVAAIPSGLLSRATTTIEVDGRVLAVAAAMIALTAIGVGLAPALRGSSAKPDLILKNAGSRTSAGRLPGALVVLEVGFSLVLLSGAALLTRTLVKLQSIDPGFEPNGLVAMHLDLPTDRYSTAAAREMFFDDVQQRLARLPGVTGSTVVLGVPPDVGGVTWGEFQDEGRGTITNDVMVQDAAVRPDYFAVTRTPIVAGRGFASGDPPNSAIISRALADLLVPGGAAIGHRFRIGTSGDWNTIVGIAGNVEGRIGLDNRTHLLWYAPWPVASAAPAPAPVRSVRRTYSWRMLVVRAANPLGAIPAIEQQIWAIDSHQPIEKVALVADMYGEAFGRQRFVLMLMTAFSLVALVLTAAGIFGLLAQMVAQRNREIGIRMALGASSAQLLRLVASRGLGLTLAGAGIGLGGALLLAPALRSLLFEVTPSDPLSYASVVALLAIVAAVASWIPARAATRVDPAIVLRVD